MKITATVMAFYVKLMVVQRIQYINQHLFRFSALFKEQNKIIHFRQGTVALKRSLKWLISQIS